MERPEYLFLNNQPVRVRGWRVEQDGIQVSAMVSGGEIGEGIAAVIASGSVEVAWDGFDPMAVDVMPGEHRVVGDGPRAVHRIAFELHGEGLPKPALAEMALEELAATVVALQREVEELRRRVQSLEGEARQGHPPGVARRP